MLPISTANQALADNVNALLALYEPKLPRPKMAARMDIGDKTLGFIKAATGNPTLDVIDRVARFFRREPWELIKPASEVREATLDDLAALATPRSRAAIEAIRQAAEEGRLTDADLVLLQHIAERFMTSTPARPGAIHAALERKLNRDADAES